MEITLPISSLIIIAIGSLGVTASVIVGLMLLFQKDKKHISIGILACLLILAGLTLLNDVLVTSGMSNRIRQLYFIPIHFSLSIPPLFYLFIKSKFKSSLNTSDFVHLIIPAIQAIVYFSIGFRSVEFKSMLYDVNTFRSFLYTEALLFPILLVGYTAFAYTLIKRNTSKRLFWAEDLKKWLLQFSAGMLLIAVIEFSFSLIEGGNHLITESDIPFYLGQTFILSAFTFWIAINGYKQYYPLQIFTSKPTQPVSPIDDKDLSGLLGKLEFLMTEDKVFLNPDLNLELLSEYLGTTEKRCSYMLKKGMNLNFNQYINQFRIEAFKERIKQGENEAYTLTSIAYECGFNSKSTFNRVFKQSCGITPSEFVKVSQASRDPK